MSKNFTVDGSVSVPLQDGQTAAPADLTLSFVYTKKAGFDLVYPDAVADDPVTFGSLAVSGAKALLIRCTAGACTVKIDGPAVTGNLPLPLHAGGYLLYANPAAGLPSGCHIRVTTSASLEILAVG